MGIAGCTTSRTLLCLKDVPVSVKGHQYCIDVNRRVLLPNMLHDSAMMFIAGSLSHIEGTGGQKSLTNLRQPMMRDS